MSLFLSRLNHTIQVFAFASSGEDDGGQPTGSYSTSKGTMLGRIDPKVTPTEVNGPDLQPVIADYLAICEIPSFEVSERDIIQDEAGAYEVLGVATLDGRSAPHHLEINLRKVTP